jgi:hypothetical protein
MKIKSYYVALLLCFISISLPGCSMFRGNTAVNVSVNAEAPVNAVVAGTPAAAGGESQTAAAEALVADLYKQHDAKKSPFFQTKDRALVDKYFTKPLADLIWKDANNSSGEVGAIDGDPLYNAQDVEIKNLAVGRADVKGDKATVPVTFTNYGQKQTVTFQLRRLGEAWKIDDIKYAPEDSLMRWLKNTYETDPSRQTSNYGVFEGTYKVGDTTCTVTPSKMVFEVRWAKGSGVELFNYSEGTAFESATPKGGTNTFIFDNESYDTGVFFREDGKEFTVTRLK